MGFTGNPPYSSPPYSSHAVYRSSTGGGGPKGLFACDVTALCVSRATGLGLAYPLAEWSCGLPSRPGHCQVVDLVWCCQDWSFVAIAARHKGYRYPIEVIGHAVWLYHRFTLSLRDVEELMLARGVVVTYETIRSWCAKFGPDYAAQ